MARIRIVNEMMAVYASYTDEAVDRARKIISGGRFVPKLTNLVRAEMHYDTNTLPWTSDPTDTQNYPLKLFFDNGRILGVSAVSAGYRGTGPHGTLEILKMVGISGESVEKIILGNGPVNHAFYPNGMVCEL